MVARSKLSNIEILTSKALKDYEISPEEYQTLINKEEKLKEDSRMMKSKKNDVWKNKINEEKGRKNKTNKNIRENTENA